jgi:hypothetical protein
MNSIPPLPNGITEAVVCVFEGKTNHDPAYFRPNHIAGQRFCVASHPALSLADHAAQAACANARCKRYSKACAGEGLQNMACN